MPLARILTLHPERTTALSEQLQQQGYRVEVVHPDQYLYSADLEIEFEICSQAEVLYRAAELAARLQADVAVASGVLRPAVQPSYEQPVLAPEPLPPVSVVGVPVDQVAESFDLCAEPAPLTQPSASFSLPEAPPAGPAALPGKQAATHAGALRKAGKAAQNIFSRVAKGSATALAAAQEFTSSTAASARQQFREYRKLARVRSAEAQAAREARLLDLEQRRAEAQKRAAELEAAREAAAARLGELMRERDPSLLQEDRNRREPPVPAPALHQQPTEQPLRPQQPFPAKPITPRRAMSPQLRAVLTGAAAACALFLIGLAVAAFHPLAPLASNATRPASGVTVQTGGVTVQTGGVTVHGTPARTQPARPSPAIHNPAPAQVRRQARRSSSFETDDVTMNDVVVKHFSPPPAKPKQTGQRAGLKHYSDMEN